MAQTLARVVSDRVGVKGRDFKLGQAQRSAAHWASATDIKEAYLAGASAVKAALRGISGKMVTLVRGTKNGKYVCTTGLAGLADVANGEKMVPAEYINQTGNGITAAFKDYVRPLVAGQSKVVIGADGLPVFARLKRQVLAKKCGPWAGKK